MSKMDGKIGDGESDALRAEERAEQEMASQSPSVAMVAPLPPEFPEFAAFAQEQGVLEKVARLAAGEALITAAQEGDFLRVKALLPFADLAPKSLAGQNALQEAVRHRRAKCLEALLPCFDAQKENNNRSTCLMEAAAGGWAEGVRLLLPASDAKAKSSAGEMTALMFAALVIEGNGECLRLLLPHSDPEASNALGETALLLAARNSRKNVEILLPVSQPLVADKYGTTPLMAAIQAGREDIAEILGPVSELRATDVHGKTAFDYAVEFPDPDSKSRMSSRILAQLAQAEKAELDAEVAKVDQEPDAGALEDAGARHGEGKIRRPPKTL